jgi:hypothetical protein
MALIQGAEDREVQHEGASPLTNSPLRNRGEQYLAEEESPASLVGWRREEVASASPTERCALWAEVWLGVSCRDNL